jgi:hypothetical protein
MEANKCNQNNEFDGVLEGIANIAHLVFSFLKVMQHCSLREKLT